MTDLDWCAPRSAEEWRRMLLEESDRFRPAQLVWVGYRGWGKLAWDHDWSLYSLSGGFSSVGGREEDLERIEEILQLARAFCERFKTFQDFDDAGKQARLDPPWLPEELRDPGVMLVAGALWDEDAEVRRRIRKMRVRMGSRRGSWRSQDD